MREEIALDWNTPEFAERFERRKRGVPICAQCFVEAADLVETDEVGVFWTYCRACDFWSEHPPEQCGTCDGSGVVNTELGFSGYTEPVECDIPCPECQQQ